MLTITQCYNMTLKNKTRVTKSLLSRHWSATNVNSCSLETTSSDEDVERTLKQLGDSEYVLLLSNILE